MAEKKTPLHPIEFGGRRTDSGEMLCWIKDPATGRKWEWFERDQPGLESFLHDLLVVGWHPYAKTGHAFKQGRKLGSVSPIRKAIARLLKKKSDMKPRELWAALADNPPRGWQFLDNRAGKYIEGPKASDGMSYKHFSGIAKKERDKRNGR